MTRFTPPAIPPKRVGDSGGKDIYQQAATGSWAAPLVAAVIGVFMSSMPNGGMIVAMVRLVMDIVLIGGGLALGAYALTGIPKRGTQGVLIPAVIGLLINGVLLLLGLALVLGMIGPDAANGRQ